MLFLLRTVPVKMFNGKTDKTRKAGDPWPEGIAKHNAKQWAAYLDDDSSECKKRIALWEKRTGRKVSDLEESLPPLEEVESELTEDEIKAAELKASESKDDGGQTKQDIFDELKALEKSTGKDFEYNMNWSKSDLKKLLEEIKANLG